MIQALSYPGNCVADEPSIERMADRVKCHEKTTSEETDRRDWNAKADVFGGIAAGAGLRGQV